MAKMTDEELRTLAANARANDGQVAKWLDRDRSLALIEEVLALRSALKEALELATPSRGRRDPRSQGPHILDMLPMYSRVGDVVTDARLAELRKLVGE